MLARSLPTARALAEGDTRMAGQQSLSGLLAVLTFGLSESKCSPVLCASARAAILD